MRRVTTLLAFALGLMVESGVYAQGFLLRDVSINGRQVQELRLGSTSRTPASGNSGAGFLTLAITNGPVAGTTTLTGAFFDGGTLFAGGALPTFTPIVAQGSAFSLGGGCQRGAVTEFPYINANRPQIARFDANTGLFSTAAVSIGNSNQYDSADCAVVNNSSFFVFTNRTLNRLEVYKDSGAGPVPLQDTLLTGVITPFSGGLRPSVAAGDFNGDGAVDILSMNAAGGTRFQLVNGNTGAVGPPCNIFSSTPPTVFIKPRETSFFVPNAPTDPRRVAAGDFNLDGVADIITVTSRGLCTFTNTPGPAGSANGGNGYNWTGYAIAQAQAGAPTNVVWGSLFYVDNSANVAQLATVLSPYAGRGGPYHACAGRNLDNGYTQVIVGTATLNTNASFALAPGIVAIGGSDNIFETDMEDQSLYGLRNCGVNFSF